MSKWRSSWVVCLFGTVCLSLMSACGGSSDVPTAVDVLGILSSPDVPPPNDFDLPAGMDEHGNLPSFRPATVCEGPLCSDEWVEDVETDADRAASSIPYSLYLRGKK